MFFFAKNVLICIYVNVFKYAFVNTVCSEFYLFGLR